MIEVMRGSGDGFVTAADGRPRWGRFGAAGVLVRCTRDDADRFLLARRSLHTHRGGTWAIPGGALDSDETPVEAAFREFAEEVGVTLGAHDVVHVHEDDHGGWSYWTVVVDVPEPFECGAGNWETDEVRWVTVEELAELDLFDAFRSTLGVLGYL